MTRPSVTFGDESTENEQMEGPVDPPDVSMSRSEEEGEAEEDPDLSKSIVNTERTDDDNRKIWGGKMVDSIIEHEGNISLFSDDCMSIDGVYSAMYSRNGWLRTTTYLLFWIGFGVLFLYLTIPAVISFRQKNVSTNVWFFDNPIEGLPLPVVTVCPRGTGVRCDCLLWRRLYCRYSTETPNNEFRTRFAGLGCIDEVQYGDPHHNWINPQCEDFANGSMAQLSDPCGPTPEDFNDEPALMEFTAEVLYGLIIQRESTPEGPYLNYRELASYGARDLSDSVSFFQDSTYLPPRPFPDDWVISRYWETSRFQLCTQIRPLDSQRTAGSRSGVGILIRGIKLSDYSVNDLGRAAAAVDVNVDVVPRSLFKERLLLSNREKYFPVRAGHITDVQYQVSSLERAQGFGEESSRTCSNDLGTIPRSACTQRVRLERAAAHCGCEWGFIDPEIPRVYNCSATPVSPQFSCSLQFLEEDAALLDISLNECPHPCTDITSDVVSSLEVPMVDNQEMVLQALDNAISNTSSSDIVVGETALVYIGLDTLLILRYSESPSETLGGLLGQIGGNAGLWCGLSFVGMFEVLEFIVVATLYGTGFYRRHRRKSLKHHITRYGRNLRPRRSSIDSPPGTPSAAGGNSRFG